MWLVEGATSQGLSNNKTGKRGASKIYSDLAIETVVTIKSIYGLAGRQAVGLIASIFKLMRVELAVPDQSMLSRPKLFRTV